MSPGHIRIAEFQFLLGHTLAPSVLGGGVLQVARGGCAGYLRFGQISHRLAGVSFHRASVTSQGSNFTA